MQTGEADRVKVKPCMGLAHNATQISLLHLELVEGMLLNCYTYFKHSQSIITHDLHWV